MRGYAVKLARVDSEAIWVILSRANLKTLLRRLDRDTAQGIWIDDDAGVRLVVAAEEDAAHYGAAQAGEGEVDDTFRAVSWR